MGKPEAAAVISGSSGSEATIATTKTLEKPVAVSINEGANVTTRTSVQASAPITTTANPSTGTKATACPSNISKDTIAVEATAPTTTNTIIASDPSVKEIEYISSKRRQFNAFHNHDTTQSAVSSKIQYQNDCYADWLAEANHVAHVEVCGPTFGGVAKRCFCCYDAMTNGSLTPADTSVVASTTTATSVVTSVCPLDMQGFIEFKYPFLGGTLIEQATNGLLYSQEKFVLASNQIMKLQEEKCHQRKLGLK